MKIFTVAEVPDDLADSWLQHLRDFDATHPGCHFEVISDAPKQPLTKTLEVLRINAGLPHLTIMAVITAPHGVGDLVEKYTGDYQLEGEVRSVFTTKAGKVRFVVEHIPGFLHIYSDANLRPIVFNDGNAGD